MSGATLGIALIGAAIIASVGGPWGVMVISIVAAILPWATISGDIRLYKLALQLEAARPRP